MSDRSEQIVSQVQALWRGALGQVGDVTGQVVRVVSERIEHERGRPENGWLDRALRQGARMADGDVMPLPTPVKKTLTRIYHAIDTRVAAQTPSPRATASRSRSRVASETKPRSAQAQPRAEAIGTDEETKRVRPSRNRRPRRREKTVEN